MRRAAIGSLGGRGDARQRERWLSDRFAWVLRTRRLPLGQDLVFASMPKSASQYLESLLLAGLGPRWRSVRGKYVNGGSQMFQSEARLRRDLPWAAPALAYGHALYCAHNRKVWGRCLQGRRAIVGLRSIPDALISYGEHLDRHGAAPLDLRVAAEGFGLEWRLLDDTARGDWLIAHVAPWYMQFLAGWLAAEADGWAVAYVRFEALKADPVDAAAEALERVSLTADRASIAAASGTRRNFNRGESGRGRETFSAAQIARLEALAVLSTALKAEPALLAEMLA
ncbi:MAG: hypothetical protein AAF160_00620 [Pseudomonadota bacterium]